jgi:hypothetical protein
MVSLPSPPPRGRLTALVVAGAALVLGAGAALAATDSARDDVLVTFRDWVVGCDNANTCQAMALEPEDADRSDTEFGAMIEREAGPGGTLVLQFGPILRSGVLDSEADAVPVVAVGDRGGRRLAVLSQSDITGYFYVTDAAAMPAVRAMLAQPFVTLLDADGAVVDFVSTMGFSAAMRLVDERQGRDGTAGALVARGPAAAATTPAAPARAVVRVLAPFIDVAPRSLAPEAIVAAAQPLARGMQQPDCAGTPDTPPQAEFHRLDAATTLAIIDPSCITGAYNRTRIVALVDEQGRARPVPLVTPEGRLQETELVNASFNLPDDMGLLAHPALSTFGKGRGLGDCGSGEVYGWTGAAFELVERTQMNECRFPLQWIRTYQAQVR